MNTRLELCVGDPAVDGNSTKVRLFCLLMAGHPTGVLKMLQFTSGMSGTLVSAGFSKMSIPMIHEQVRYSG